MLLIISDLQISYIVVFCGFETNIAHGQKAQIL